MNRCRYCKRRIDGLDFYMGLARGSVCSSCLVVGKPPREEIQALFQAPGPGLPPKAEREMSLEELQQAVRAF